MDGPLGEDLGGALERTIWTGGDLDGPLRGDLDGPLGEDLDGPLGGDLDGPLTEILTEI